MYILYIVYLLINAFLYLLMQKHFIERADQYPDDPYFTTKTTVVTLIIGLPLVILFLIKNLFDRQYH